MRRFGQSGIFNVPIIAQVCLGQLPFRNRARAGDRWAPAGMYDMISKRLLLLLFCGIPLGCAHVRPFEEPTGAHFSILTYNVNYGLPRSPKAAAAAVRILAEENADVVVLQESNGAWERILTSALSRRYPHRLFRNRSAAGGMAVLSRFPLKELAWFKPSAGWFHAWLIRVETSVGPVQLVSVHLRPPLSEQRSGPTASVVRNHCRREHHA